jgi:tetratricopeptide (TPR) repeat protein
MLDAELKVFGELHDDPIGSLVQITDLRERLEEFVAAKGVRQRVVELQSKRFGKGHRRVTDARIASEGVDLVGKLDAASRKELTEALSRQSQLVAEYRRGNSAQAAKLGEAIVAMRRKVWGEAHPDYATCLNNLAENVPLMGQYAKAEPLYLEVVSRIIDHVESNSEGQSEASQLARTGSIHFSSITSCSIPDET